MDEFTLQILRLSLPLMLAALSETVAERSGTVNLGLEGMMLSGAWTACFIAAGESPGMLIVAWAAASAVGLILGLLLALWTAWWRSDQIVSGWALHFLCLGGTGLLFERFKSSETVTTFSELSGAWSWVPYGATVLFAGLIFLWMFRTRSGLRLQAAGHSPQGLRATGASPAWARTMGLMVAGALAGIAGATLTTVLTGQFVEGMSAGRGFLALSLVLLARWHPAGALVAGLFLGTAFGLELHLSTADQLGDPSPLRELLLRSAPYLATILALAVAGPKRLRAPAALGQPLPSTE